ncbi:MAG TPA: glycoside hydrolase family 20 zincin-like fold domain-containing protein [bacterium]|jgi:hypothetical protein
MRGLPFHRILALLLLVCVARYSYAGLRDIHPRPQQMGLLASQPVALAGTPYLLIPDNPNNDEQLAVTEAQRLVSERTGQTPIVVNQSAYTGQSPAIWLGTPARFPALEAALDSTGIDGMGLITHPEEYQLVVQDGRILLAAADQRGVRWGMMSLVELMSTVMGRIYVDQAYIRDWPLFPKRIGTINTPLRIPSDVSYANLVADYSYNARMNEIEANLPECGNRSAYPTWVEYMTNLSARIRNRAQVVTMSTDATAHNVPVMWWQEGVPIRGTLMRVNGTAFVPVADGYHIVMPNGDFESWTNSRPTGWQMANDTRYAYVFRDAVTQHSGQSAIKFTGFGSNSPSDMEMYSDVYFGPSRLLKIKFWYKTSGYRGQVLINLTEMRPPYNRFDNRFLSFSAPTTQDWTLQEVSFCTYNADTGTCMIGPWCPAEGTLWLDDITFETADLSEMVRRSDTPLAVRKAGQFTTPLIEGVDYRAVETYSTTYPQYLKQPRLERLTGGQLSDGDTVSVDWSSAMRYQGGRQTECFSLLDPLLAYQDRIAALDSMLHPDGFKIHINEVSYANYDETCTSRHMTPAQLVGSYCRQMYQIIQGRRPGAPVRIYGDAFDTNVHDVRAMPVTVTPWTIGSLQELPSAVEMMAMLGYSDNLDSSMTYFNSNGHSSVMAVQLWTNYGDFIEAVRAAKRHIAACPGVQFYMWDGDCNDQLNWRIPDFGDMAWNIGPYIVHSPPQFSSRPDSIRLFAEMWTDSFHRAEPTFLTSTTLTYRWLPAGSFATVPLARTGTDGYAATIQAVPSGATGISYYLSATDHRGETHSAPADAPQRTFTAMFPLNGQPPGSENAEPVTFSVRSCGEGTLVEWPQVSGIQWYEVHAGTSPDFGEHSRTLLSRQSPSCPRYLLPPERGETPAGNMQVYGFRTPDARKQYIADRKK